MARNRKTYEKRIRQIEQQLRTGWPVSNPKAAQARWLLIKELAQLKDVPVKDIKRALKEGTM